MNTVKMLAERGYMKDLNHFDVIKNVLKTPNDTHIYSLPITKMPGTESKKFMLNYAPYKISSFTKSYGIKDFIDENHLVPKIIVVSSIADKMLSDIRLNYPFTEVFLEKTLMENIVDHEFVPRHILLSKEEAEEVRKEYLINKKQLPRIYAREPIARYYNMKVGDICKVIRHSGESGYDVIYRIVIPGSATM